MLLLLVAVLYAQLYIMRGGLKYAVSEGIGNDLADHLIDG